MTGGSRGIGRAIAEALARAGARVVICGKSAHGVEKAAAELKDRTGGEVFGYAADVSKRDEVNALFEFADSALGRVDIVVNNAAIGIFASVAAMRPEEWNRVIETNLSGVFFCCQAALIRFGKVGGGALIQIGSLAGKHAFAGSAAYSASKFALNGFSEALMLDHRQENVRVCTILPGSVDTEFMPGAKSSPWKIAPEDIGEIVLAVLRLPDRTMVSHIEVRPSKPLKH